MSTTADRPEVHGICTSCNHADGCGLRLRGPIWSCEEFDDTGAATSQPRLAERDARANALVAAVAQTRGATLGICSNCEELAICGLPRHEGGVWHCEQYA